MSLKSLLHTIRSNVRRYYNSTLKELCQRRSNNSEPKFSDVDAITSYILGIKAGFKTKKDIHRYIKEHCSKKFRNIPCYGQYCERINKLAPIFKRLCELQFYEQEKQSSDHIIDSFPVVVAQNKRINRAKTAKELCSGGYCSTKKMWYYGVKVHIFAECRSHKIPIIRLCSVTEASEHDLTTAKNMTANEYGINIFGDKAYNDREFGYDLELRDCDLLLQFKQYGALGDGEQAWNVEHSKSRQLIESLFSLINRSGMANASSVRSLSGLLSFIYARFAALPFSYS